MKTSPFDAIKKPSGVEKSQQWPQYIAILSATLCALGAGIHFGWPSPSLRKMQSDDFHFNVTGNEFSYITSIAPFGYLIGCPLSAVIVDIIGRKRTLLLLAVPQLVAWMLIACAKVASLYYVARFITGIGEGALLTVLPMYLGEISEPKVRGVLGSSLSVAFIGGILLINCYGSYVPIETAAIISMTIPLLFVSTFVWMPESPYYYLMKGRIEDARNTLMRLRRMTDVESELMKLNADVDRQVSEPGSVKDIFSNKTNRKAFFIILGLRTVQVYSGLAAFNLYTQKIFEQAGEKISPSLSAIIYTATQMCVTFFGSVLADKFGRRPLLIGSCACAATSLISEAVYFYFKNSGHDMSAFNTVPLIGMMVYIVSFSFGLGVVPILMLSELFAANIKAKALSVLTIYFAIGVSTSAKLFQALELYLGIWVPFLIFSVVCFSGILLACFFVPETKGRSLEEIQQILKGKDCAAEKEDRVTRF